MINGRSSGFRWKRASLALVLVPLLFQSGASASDEALGGLPRRGLLGTKLRSAADEARRANRIESGPAVEVETVLPGSAAEAAGLRDGDVIRAINEAAVSDPAELVRSLGGKRGGDAIQLSILRGGEKLSKTVTLKPAPLETSAELDVVYDAVPSRAGRLRTILTKPKGQGKHPALLLIQGVGMFSVDNPTGPLASYRTISDAFAREGFTTLRVDKPGCGDSEGGPAEDVDFDTELDGYRQALKALKAHPSVDPDRVFIFGHSMGGVMAPLLATEVPVKGIAVYGTVSRTWNEYMLENIRRQMELSGNDPGEIDQTLRLEAAVLHRINGDHLSPKEIAEKYPELKARVEGSYPDGHTFVGRTYRFFQQLSAKNLGQAWHDCPAEVLAAWGTADFVSSKDDHERIARIVNEANSGKATFLAIDGCDHGFLHAGSLRESQARTEPGEFNPAFLDAMKAWILKRAAP